MKKAMIMGACLVVVSVGCEPRKVQEAREEERLMAGAFALGCVTAIRVANESPRPLAGKQLAIACAQYWLTNDPGTLSNMFVEVIRRCSK